MPSTYQLNPSQLSQYQRDGFYLYQNLFSREETQALIRFAQGDQGMAENTTGRKDAEGNQTKLSLWNDPPDNLFGLFSRSPRLVQIASQLLDDEVYHYHSKMMLKEARTGGAWEWHQDYGYWYNYGCLYPQMISCLIALDRADQTNGCLQVIPGTHLLGRMDHGKTGEQTGADLERVNAVLQQKSIHFVEAEPGDVLFFHCNLLHRSDANRSDRSRWSLICCYNARSNDPYKESRHPNYRTLVISSDDELAAAVAEVPV